MRTFKDTNWIYTVDWVICLSEIENEREYVVQWYGYRTNDGTIEPPWNIPGQFKRVVF